MADDHCLNCNEHIREINYALGKRWMHVDPAASFPTEHKGTAWRFCRQKVATPSNHRGERMSNEQHETDMPPTPIADNAANSDIEPAPMSEGLVREALVEVLVEHRAMVSGDEDGWHIVCGCGYNERGTEPAEHVADAILASPAWAEREGEIERLRERIHEAVDECQRRHAPYVSRCAKFDAWSKWARDHFERVDDNTWSHGSEANRLLILSVIEEREAAEAERDRLAEQVRRARQVYLDAVNAGLTVQPTALRDAIEDQP